MLYDSQAILNPLTNIVVLQKDDIE